MTPTDKEREDAVWAEADRRSREQLKSHPCGCGVCGMNLMLVNLRAVREKEVSNAR